MPDLVKKWREQHPYLSALEDEINADYNSQKYQQEKQNEQYEQQRKEYEQWVEANQYGPYGDERDQVAPRGISNAFTPELEARRQAAAGVNRAPTAYQTYMMQVMNAQPRQEETRSTDELRRDMNRQNRIARGTERMTVDLAGQGLRDQSLLFNPTYTSNLRTMGQTMEAQQNKAAAATNLYQTLSVQRREQEEREKFAALLQNPDFAAKSQGDPAIGRKVSATSLSPAERLYQNIYNHGGEKTNAKDRNAAEFVSDEEAGIFFYLWNTQGPRAAQSYYNDYVDNRASQRRAEAAQAQAETFGHYDILGSSAESVVANAVSGVGLVDMAWQNIARSIGLTDKNKPLNYYSSAQLPGMVSDAIRKGAADEIAAMFPKVKIGKGENAVNVASFLYETGMSMADSSVAILLNTIGIPEAATLGMMGAAAGTRAIRDARERGASDGQALAFGISSAIMEALFEKISLERILTESNAYNLKQSILGTLQQGFTEGSEEVMTTLANTAADMFIMGDKAEVFAMQRRLMEQGVSEKEALKAALTQWGTGILGDAIGGFLSGAGMGGVKEAANARNNPLYQWNMPMAEARALQNIEQNGISQERGITPELQRNIDAGIRAQNEREMAQDRAMLAEDAAMQREAAQRRAAPPLPQQAGQITPESVTTPPVPQNAQRGAESAERTGDPLISPSGPASPRGSQEAGAESQTLGNPPAPGLRVAETGGNNSGENRLRIPENPQNVRNSEDNSREAALRIAAREQTENRESGSGLRIVGTNRQQQKTAQQRQLQEEGNRAESLRDRGFRNAGEGETVYVRSEERWDAEERAVAEALRENGIEPTFVTGLLQDADGKRVTSLMDGEKLAIQADNRSQTVQSIAERATGLTLDIEGDTLNENRNGGLRIGRQTENSPAAEAGGGGTALSGEEQERLSGQRAGKQAGRLDQIAGAGQQNPGQLEKARARRSAADAAGRVTVSNQMGLGIRKAKKGSRSTIISEKQVQEDAELRTVARNIKRVTGLDVSFTLGGVDLGDGQYANGVYTKRRIVVQADDEEITATQLALHELYHYFADKDPGLNERLRQSILEANKGEALDRLVDLYIENYGEIVGLNSAKGEAEYQKALDRIREEIYANAYSGINAFGGNAEQFTEEVRTGAGETEKRLRENAAATAQRTGPPKQKSTASLKKDLRDKLLSTFHTPDGYKQYLGNMVGEYADRILEKGSLTDEEATALFDALYEEGSVKTAADEAFQEARKEVRGAKIYVPESIKHEFSDDWRDFQRRAFGQGVLLTNNPADMAIDEYHAAISAEYPGVFDPDETDMRTILETIVNVADSGKGKTVSLRDYGTSLEAYLQDGWAYDSREEQQAELRRTMENALQEFADQAGRESYSLKEFKDGKRFVDVQTDQAMFDNLSDTEKLALARIIIKKRFAGKVIGIDNQAFVNGRTAAEYSRIKKPLPEANTGIMDAKARVSTELDNLIDAGFNFRTAEDGADGHTHDTLTGPYNYFDAIFKVGDEYFQGVVNLENNRNGRRFKDVTKIKNITKDTAGSYGENPTTRFLRDVSMPRIAGEEEKSNSESQEKKKVFNRTALVTEQTVDRWLKDYAAASSPKYAQAYITRMTPDQFLKLTTSISGRLTIGQQTEELDPEKLIAATQQNPIQLIVRDGEVEGHEGRHRANALRRAGVESIPVLVFDSSNKYSKESVPEMQLMGQNFGRTRSYAIETLRDLTPLNYENRDKIVRDYSIQPATERLREKYSDTDTIRFSLKGQTGAEQTAAPEARTLGSREVLDTPALRKLGVKVSGSVGDYGKTESLIAKDRAAKSLQREARRAEKRLRATDAEKDFANGITAGIYREEDIPKRLNKDTVMELADYYWAMNSANLQTLHQLRADINAGLRDEAEGFLAEADIKPISMIELNERTPERAFRKMFGEKAQGITKWLLDPVRENEAEKIRWYNQQMDAVRKFTDSKGKSRELTRAESALTMRLMEGRAAADMVAGMETKAAIENAAQNIRKGGDAADAAREFSLSSEERDLAEKYAGWLSTQEELKTADSTIVEAAAKKYAELFDDYYGAINDFLVAHGYEPIGYIKGYAPHMQPEENQSLLEKAFKQMGINEAVTELPASIAGQTAFYKPNKRWNPYFLQRNGSEANYDIVKAYQSYVDYMADILFHTDDVMRVRQTANWIRQTYAPEEIRQQLEWARELRQAPMEDKQRLLRDAGEIGQSTVLSAVDTAKAMQDYIDKLYKEITDSTKNSNLVMWLDEYANNLAGKQSMADRGREVKYGRKILNFGLRVNNIFQKANVAGNLSSILNQTAQLPMIYAELGERDFTKAIFDLATGKTKAWAKDSDFLTAKEGKELLYTDNADKFINALFAPAGFMDHLVSTVAVRGAFNKAIRQGASYAEAMQRADAFGQAVMGSRAKGSMPLAYSYKGFFDKMQHMFQVEAINSWDHLVSDLPREIRSIAKTEGKGKAAMALAGLILRALIGAFTLNRLTDELYGGTPAPFDVLGLTANFVASGKGLSTNAYIRTIIDNTMEKMGHERLFGTEAMTKEDFDLEAAADDLLYNVMNDVPFARNIAGIMGWGDQTMPLPGAGGEFKNLWTDVKNLLKEGVEPGEIENLLKAMGLAATQFIPGGRQISKTAQGAEAIIRGGSYNGYKKPKLQYPLEGATDLVKALLFGKNATNAAKEYWAAGGNALTEKQTALYTALASHGVGRKEAYDAIQKYREIANDDSMTSYERGKAERALLAGLGISDEDKLDMYRELNDAESKAAKFRAIMDKGLSFDQVMTIQDKYAEIDGKEGLKAGDKAKEFYLWVDNQSYTANQKTEIKNQLKYFQSIPAEAARYDKLTASGLSPDMSAKIDQAIGKLEPEAGKTDVSDTQKWQAAMAVVSGEANQEKALQALMTEEQYAKYQKTGVSPTAYVNYKAAVSKLVPLPGQEGITNAQEWNAALKSLGTNAGKKDKLALVGDIVGTEKTTKTGEPTQWAKINRVVDSGKSVEDTMKMVEDGKLDVYVRWMDSDAKTAGVKSDTYLTWRETYANTNSTRDENGKEVKGQAKKDKILAYIDGLNLTREQKDALFLEEYKESGLKDTPWHKGGGKGSGSYAPARLVTRKTPEAPQTTKPRSGLVAMGQTKAAAKPRGGLVATGRPYNAGTGGLVLKKK